MKQTSAEARIENTVARYFAVADEIAALKREEAALGEQIEEWLEDNREDSISLEGLGSVGWHKRTNRTYDVSLIAEHDPMLFRRLLELHVLDINKSRLDANAGLIGIKVPVQEGETKFLARERRK